MKFCFWGNIYGALTGDTPGGAELQLSIIIKKLVDLGHNVSVIDFYIKDDERISNNLVVYSLARRSSNYLHRLISFYKLLIEQDSHYYYARMPSSFHLIGYIAARKLKKKFVLGLAHDLDTLNFHQRYNYKYRLRKGWLHLKQLITNELIFNYLLKKADFVIAQHEVQQMNLKKRGIYADICLNLFDNTQQINNKQHQGGISNFSNESYLFLGSIDKSKGVDMMENIILRCKTTNFKIIGRCRDEYSKRKLQRIISNKNVVYYNQLSHDEVFNHLTNSKALISTSLMEGFPNTFLESWSVGTPVISLNVNPGNVITKFDLGAYCNGDFNYLIEIIEGTRKMNTDPFKLMDYINQNHNSTTNIKKFLNIIKSKN
jgi:glycosyltransferase involved in cell wall biosynthesis